MVDSNLYVENPANKTMHYGDNPIVGILNLPEKTPAKKLYSYFDGQKLYNVLQQDIWVQSNKANPKEKGVPTIIKIITAGITAAALLLFGAKGIKNLFAKFRH